MTGRADDPTDSGTSGTGSTDSGTSGADPTDSGTSGADDRPGMLRIGEVAKVTGLTTRTLRYWEELGLLSPSAHRGGGERRYSTADMARAIRIRDLQDLLGFSLSEVRVVLEVQDVEVLDRVRSKFRFGEPLSGEERLALVDEAIVANQQLVARLDDTVARIRAFRDERAASGVRLRATRTSILAELGEAAPVGRGEGPSRPARGARTAKPASPRATSRPTDEGRRP